ncbi:hypothetical protein [Novipirellula artificiosorum]|uniref:hypothetical protein n=1 Tax=Novipirellula artificiosorum TaxID=2528016 RepID=UPI0011B35BF5|nr:hypothetical protein [Novipirellula artificiosorum]
MKTDQAITLIYSIPIKWDAASWLENPRSKERVQPGRESISAERFHLGANARISRYPFAAVMSP